MKQSELKKESQLQQWAGAVKEQKESSLTVRQWCLEQGIPEHAYYYRLHKVRQSMCNALDKIPSPQLAEIPVAPSVMIFWMLFFPRQRPCRKNAIKTKLFPQLATLVASCNFYGYSWLSIQLTSF